MSAGFDAVDSYQWTVPNQAATFGQVEKVDLLPQCGASTWTARDIALFTGRERAARRQECLSQRCSLIIPRCRGNSRSSCDHYGKGSQPRPSSWAINRLTQVRP
jgi:hypothetical protein